MKQYNYPAFIGLLVLFAVLIRTGVFTKLDYRIYDFLLGRIKEPPQSKEIVHVNIDDESIAEEGQWPWGRNVLADVTLRLREVGAKAVVFDVEYLSPSSPGLSADSVSIIDNAFSAHESQTRDLLDEFASSIAQGYISRNEINSTESDMLQNYYSPSLDECKTEILTNISFDFDEYFARSLAFFGNSYLTVNTHDLKIKNTPDEINYVVDNLLRANITDTNGLIKKANRWTAIDQYQGYESGFTPALHKLLTRTKGVGFTNVIIDTDGCRRRIELLFEKNGKYLAQLSFSPLIDFLDVQSLERKGDALYLLGAQYPGTFQRTDVKIPLDENGRILINYLHKDFAHSFKHESVSFFRQQDALEQDIETGLKNILSLVLRKQNGELLEYYQQSESLLSTLQSLKQQKISLLSQYSESNLLHVTNSASKTDATTDSAQSDNSSPATSSQNATKSPQDDAIYMEGNFTDNEDTPTQDTLPLSESYTQDETDNITDQTSNITTNFDKESAEGDYFTQRAALFHAIAAIDTKKIADEVDACLQDLQEYISADDAESFKTTLFSQYDTLVNNAISYCKYFDQMKSNCEGAICLVGDTASSTTDNGATPFIRIYPNVGLHANLMNTILQKDFITPIRWYIEYAIVAILLLVSLLFCQKKDAAFQLVVKGTVTFVASLFPFVLMLAFKIYAPFIGIIFFALTNYAKDIATNFYASTKEKHFIRDTFSQFVAKEVVDEIIKDPEKAKLGGRTEQATALFSDIKSFSTFSELVTPERLVEILNEYLGAMSDDIIGQRGTIDKYIGDSIVSLFGAPVSLENHAFSACCAAIHMKKTEKEFNDKHAKAGDVPKPLFTRIGINSGDMVVGNMGTTLKKNYTMMGDNVNLASRLEGVNKVYGTWILCSQETWTLANKGEHEGVLVAKRLDKVRVVGKTKPVQLYNIVGFRAEISVEQLREIDKFHSALDMYLQKDFVGAKNAFEEASRLFDDPTALIFAQRCQQNIENPVGKEWDGVVNLTSK